MLSDITDRKSKEKVALLSIDLTDAFNMVNHRRSILTLWRQLSEVKDEVSDYIWILSFLIRWFGVHSFDGPSKKGICRTSRFTDEHGRSSIFPILRGTPQGSPLSACIFLSYFNFQPVDKEIGQFIYADDGNYIVSGASWLDVKAKITLILEQLTYWCCEFGMELSLEKSCVMYFGSQSKKADEIFQILQVRLVYFFRLLGVIIDSRLIFNNQVTACKAFWSSRLFLLRKFKKLGMSSQSGLQIAYAFRGKLNFGIFWWTFLSDTQRNELNVLWRKAVRIVYGLHRSTPVAEFMKALAIPDLTNFIIYLIARRRFIWYLLGKSVI